MLLKMAFRNVLRNKRRSLLTSVGIIIAVMLIVYAQGFITGAIDNLIENSARIKSGHLRIVTPEYSRRDQLLPLSESVYITPELQEMISSTPEVKAYTYRIQFGVLLSKGENSKPALATAIDVEREKGFVNLSDPKHLVQGSYLAHGDHAVLMGKGLAEKLGFKPGDSLTIITSDAYGSPAGMNLDVKGIVATGMTGLDDNSFWMPLSAGQELLGLEGRAAEVLVLLNNRESAESVAKGWSGRAKDMGLEVIPWQADDLLAMMPVMTSVFWVVYLIILLVASATIVNTMLMVVFERIKEIGILKAMGMRGKRILVMLTAEASMIGLLGSAVGALLGTILSLVANRVDLSVISGKDLGSVFVNSVIYTRITPIVVLGCFAFGWLVATVAALYPARQGTKVEPATALRRI